MISENLANIKITVPENVILVAVSKMHPPENIMEAYNAGQRVFGENKVQEMLAKYEALPKDIEWHMIGHLQSNKVKYIAPFVNLIHSVDSIKLLQTINKEAMKLNRIINCLLEVYIAKEETKYGLDPVEIVDLLKNHSISDLKNVRIRGLMGMASFTDDLDVIRNEFKRLKSVFDNLKATNSSPNFCFDTLSMGMSGDYQIAIEEGATIIRIGSTIFGSRTYDNSY